MATAQFQQVLDAEIEKQGHIVLAGHKKGQLLETGNVAQLVEYLPRIHKALGSSHSSTKQQQNDMGYRNPG